MEGKVVKVSPGLKINIPRYLARLVSIHDGEYVIIDIDPSNGHLTISPVEIHKKSTAIDLSASKQKAVQRASR